MFATLVLGTAFLAATKDDPKAELRHRAAELVAQLGDVSFKHREKAADGLVKLGSAAVEPLRNGLAHADVEIADRCRKLLPYALDRQFEEQIEIFLAKPDTSIPDGLPGMKRWVKIAGVNKDSRQLYALFAREHRHILFEIEQQPARASQCLREFCQEVSVRVRYAPIESRHELIAYSEVVLFLFLGADPDTLINGRSGSVFLTSTHVSAMLAGTAANDATKHLFLAWLEQQRQSTTIRRGFQAAAAAELKEAAPMALRLAADTNATPLIRSAALTSALKLFGAEHLKQIEGLMTDEIVVGRTIINGEPAAAQIRDIALGVAIEVSGQKPADYGFERFRANTPTPSYFYYALTDKQRDEALQKWKDWREISQK